MPKDERKKKRMTYKGAGVSIDAGDRAVELIREEVRSTYNEGVVGDIGGFAGFYSGKFPDIKEPLLVSSTDGVGTKLLLAIKSGIVNTVGIDLVAMGVNDIICCGARPLFFLDYIACGKNQPERIASIVKGIAEGCRQAGCALIGGEMAEMPDMYAPDEFDLAGFCVGVVDCGKVIDGSRIAAGDILVGLHSSGLHSNGYSLVRKIIDSKQFGFMDEVAPLPRRLIDYLLQPTMIYVETILDLLARFEIHGIVNITGGGITGNVPRIFPKGLSAKVERASWRPAAIFAALQEWGNVADEEMFRVFNMGIGMIIIVPANQADDIILDLMNRAMNASIVGRVIEGDGGVVYA